MLRTHAFLGVKKKQVLHYMCRKRQVANAFNLLSCFVLHKNFVKQSFAVSDRWRKSYLRIYFFNK